MAIREGRWDCQYCGAAGLLGREKVCPRCARSRPEGTKFYLAEDEGTVAEAGLEEMATLGPDWICQYCSSSNPANLSACRHCNAAREATSPEQKVRSYSLDAVPTSGDMDLDAPPERQPAQPSEKTRPGWLIPAVGAFIVLCLALFGFRLFQTDELPVTVDTISWQRSVQVEELKTVAEEAWELPDGGRILREREEIHHYDHLIVGYETRQRQVSEQVQVGQRTYICGQRDLGNGFFEDVECSDPVYETQSRTENYEEPVYEEVPVYQTRYTYELDRWIEGRLARAHGTDHQPYWPKTNLAENERDGDRNERYQIVFVDDDGNRYEMDFEEEEWLTFERHGRYRLKVNRVGNPVEVVR